MDRDKGFDGAPNTTGNSTAELMGRQSVRATFRLSEACIDAISILATHLGIKQKSVFDHLMEQTQVLHGIAEEMEHLPFFRGTRTQKTFVISRKSLVSLERIANDFDLPRDALIEYSVKHLLPVIEEERKKHEFRKRLLLETKNHYQRGKELLNRAESFLGKEDPLTRRLESLMVAYRNLFDDLKAFIEKGKRIEAFEPESFKGMEDSAGQSGG